MTDTTMRALLDVHRAEINDRDQEITRLEQFVDTLRFERNRVGREKDQADRLRVASDERARANREKATELETQVAKLQGVTESLNLELGTERQDHTAARDALRDILKVVISEQFPADKVADIIRILDELGYHEHVHVAYTTSEPDNATH